MINTQLLILMVIIIIIITISTFLIKRITLSEGLISIAISNISLILLWSIAINVLITDKYTELYKVDSIGYNVESKNTEYNHNWYIYSGKHRFNIHTEMSKIDKLNTPNWINEKYKRNGIFHREVEFRNIYDNLGQYSFSSFKEEKTYHRLFVNNSTYKDYDINERLLDISIKSKLNVYVVLTDSSVKTNDIVSNWSGVKLNDILIHIINHDGDISLSNIYTWGNGVENKTFIKVLSENLNYVNLNNSNELISTINQFIYSFKKPNDQIYNVHIQSIKPDVWVVLGLILSSLIITMILLFIMIKYTRS